MAYNDMEVIAYKILSYLYECMKYGVTPRPEDLEASSSMLRIPERYRQQVVEALLNEGLVIGFCFTDTKDGRLMIMRDDAAITLSGREYLAENSRMAEAKAFLGQSFQTMLSAMVQAIVAATIR